MPGEGEPPIRVAVVGGGCAAMAAAFALTEPEQQGRFEVTVYQLGWRLGGKGASGRGPNGRIEEHGLHVWMGCYENAFRLMRRAYAELGRVPGQQPMATWKEAFARSSHIGLANWAPHRDWAVWSTIFPELPGEPGDPLQDNLDNPFTVQGYLVRMAAVMGRLFEAAYGLPGDASPGAEPPDAATAVEQARRLLRATTGATDTSVGLLYNQVRAYAALLAAAPGAEVVSALAEALLVGLDRLRPADAADPHRQRAAEILELTTVAALGIVRAGLLTNPAGFDVLDDLDFVEWLRRNGASEHALHSPFMRGLYSLMFAYEDGDFTRPQQAAGQALRGCLRMFFTYRGSFFWKMQAGMGDIVFTPIYEVLRRRGVRFEFFHKLTNVGLAPSADHVDSLVFDVQARPVAGREYAPLVDVRGLPCWPSQPDWAQLENGDTLRREAVRFESFWDQRSVAQKTLRVGADFDFVVLGVSVGAVPYVCSEILDVDPRWRDMVANLKTVATQALQLWTDAPLSGLGWERGSVTMTGFVSPFDTWSDMTHLLRVEDWPQDASPASIAYFCNVLDEREVLAAGPRDPGHQDRVQGTVRTHAERFVTTELPRLWPGLGDDPRAADLATQFYVGNVNPSDRYVQCVPGTPKYRISPLDRTYDNLTITGDWTDCGLSLGCVESSVMAGLLASHALSGWPKLEAIIGYDHP